MRSPTKTIRVKLSFFIIAFVLNAFSSANAFHEGWESSPVGTYHPDDSPLTIIAADEGDWILADTVSEFPECGATPHTAEILLGSGNRNLRLTSNDSNSSCLDNVWVVLFEVPQLNLNPGFSVPLTSGTIISFEETGNLISPETGSPYCVNPPCGDTVSLVLEDSRGNKLAYVLQRAPGAVPNEVHSFYREVFLDPNAGAYSRNLFADFSTIPDFNPSGVSIITVAFEVSEHGTATIDNICIGTSGCVPPPLVTVPDVVGLTQGAAEAAIVAALLSVGTVTTQTSNTVPAGSVISQAPVGGTQVTPYTGVDLVVSAGVPVSANFSANPRIGVAPLRVSFTEESAGNVTSWHWSFGDGASSSIQNPSHTYTDPGTYTVSLTVSGPGGPDTETKTDYIFAINEFKILSSDGVAGDYFGDSVSISGDYAIVGAFGDDDLSGSAYIFERSGSSWDQAAKLTAGDGAADDQFGRSVSIFGDCAIVGAALNDDNGENSGSAYIFERIGSSWNQITKLTASDGAAGDLFGYSVSVSGNYAIVGAVYDNDNEPSSGSAYIFERSGDSWDQVAKLIASDGVINGRFGWSVSISGDYVIVGALRSEGNYGTYIFEKGNSIWNQTAKLPGNPYSVSISGTYAITGLRDSAIDTEYAFIFQRSGNNWNRVAVLTPNDWTANDHFGTSVSIFRDYAIVGAYADDDVSGSAYLFKGSGSSWSQIAKLTATDGVAGDYFGWSVSISGDYAIVGAFGDDDNESYSGSAYFFDLSILGDISGSTTMPWIPFLLFGEQ